jgi:hypothetical protein
MVGLTGQPGKDREARTSWKIQRGHDSNDKTARSGELWARLLGKGSWDRRAGAAQMRKDRPERKTAAGKTGQDIWKRTTRIGQLRQIMSDKSY